MMISFRYITVLVFLLALISGCSKESDTNTVNVDEEKSNGAFPVPGSIQTTAISPDNLSAYLIIDDGVNAPRREPMIVSSGIAVFNAPLSPGTYTFTMEFEYDDDTSPYNGIRLASATKLDITLSPGVNNNIEFLDSDYGYPDDDGDGVYNIIELEQNYNPMNINDKPPLTCSVDQGIINCVPITYSIGGIIFGLSADRLQIQLNANEIISVNAGSTEFSFDLLLLDGDNSQNYQVLIVEHPSGQTCSVVNGSGVATGDVMNIQIGCFSEIIPTVESLSGKAIVTWNPEGAQQYDIYQSSAADFNYAEYPTYPDANLYSLVTSPYEVVPLSNGSTYYMVVVASFAGGHVVASNPVVVQPNRSVVEQMGDANAVDWGLGLFVDSNGDLYLTGNSAGAFVDATSHIGSQDIINMKFDNTGVEQWRTQSGSTGGEYGRSIVVDSSGNLFVVGETGGDFGGAPANDGQFSKYLAKYDSSGALLWAKELGLGRATGVNIDSNDNVIVTGQPCSVSMYDNDGIELWGTFVIDTSTNCSAIAVDASDNIYVVGSTALSLAGANSNQGDWDSFLVKFDPTGAQQNLVQIGTVSTDYGYAIDIDNSGNVYFTGMTGGTLGDNFIKDVVQADVFVMKLDNDFNKIWAFQYNAGPSTEGRSIKVDSLGNSYIAGKTEGAFEGYLNPGLQDMFIIKLDDLGALAWAKQYGTEFSDHASSLAIDEAQNLIYITGYSYGVLGASGSTSGDVILITEPM